MEIQLANQIFTQSEIAMWDECPFKWYQRYQLQQNLKGALNWSLLIGSVWHEALEGYYSSRGVLMQVCNIAEHKLMKDVVVTGDIRIELEWWQQVMEATAQAYEEFYTDDFKLMEILDTEKVLETDIEIDGVPIRLAGKRDLKVLNKKTKKICIWDHKTTGQISKSLTEGWDYKFQFMLYNWLDQKCSPPSERSKEFMINAVKKTALRQGKNEHIVTFAGRVKSDILCRPTEYFYRQNLDLTADGLQRFERDILFPKLRRIATLQKQPELIDVLALNKNTDACNNFGGQCEFFAKCFHGETKQYKTRKIKHEEL